jgi:hypothetical protein
MYTAESKKKAASGDTTLIDTLSWNIDPRIRKAFGRVDLEIDAQTFRDFKNYPQSGSKIYTVTRQLGVSGAMFEIVVFLTIILDVKFKRTVHEII